LVAAALDHRLVAGSSGSKLVGADVLPGRA